MSDFSALTFKGLSRADLVRARARLLGNPEFAKALAAGETEARDALKDLSAAVIETGGKLNEDEMRITGHE